MIERKLKAYGIKKVVPDQATLEDAYRAFHRSEALRPKFEAIAEAYDAKAKDVAIPKELMRGCARFSTSTATSDGTMRCRSCSTSKGWSAFAPTKRRPGRKRATSPASL